MMSLETQQWLEATANIVTSLGIVFATGSLIVAVWTYRAERRKERREREYGTYDDLDNKYVEFMYVCTKNVSRK